MLRVKALREFYELASQNNCLTNGHLKNITEGLLGHILPIHAISKKKHTMSHVMRKPQSITFKPFSARLTEMNNFLPLLPILEASKKMTPEELNHIILNAFPKTWGNKSYVQGWDF